jgi:CCR4-NOT transcriptional complex subunit CAF120
MAAAGSSPTPQWDSRNRGFIPPSQLQRLRQSSPLAREFSSERPRSMAAASSFPSQSPPTLRPSPMTASTHTRSSSFFAFLRSNDNSPSTMPPRSAEPGPRHQNSSDEIGRLSQPLLPSPSALDRSPSLPAQSQPMQLHPEIRSVVTLTHAHAHKVYMSGPLIRRVERLPDGHHPIKDEGWRDVWAQLGGTTLSIWDMKEIEEASKQGKEVPPTYINVTDAVSLFLPQLLLPYNRRFSLCMCSAPSRYPRQGQPPLRNTVMSSPSTRRDPTSSSSLARVLPLLYPGLRPYDSPLGRKHALRRFTLLILSASP